MSDILNQVTPLSRGIIWLRSEDDSNVHYKWIDYLLDGLLTAGGETTTQNENCLFVGKNFGKDFFVFISRELHEKELSSFYDLVRPSLGTEEDLIVIDDSQKFTALSKITPKDIQAKFRKIS